MKDNMKESKGASPNSQPTADESMASLKQPAPATQHLTSDLGSHLAILASGLEEKSMQLPHSLKRNGRWQLFQPLNIDVVFHTVIVRQYDLCFPTSHFLPIHKACPSHFSCMTLREALSDAYNKNSTLTPLKPYTIQFVLFLICQNKLGFAAVTNFHATKALFFAHGAWPRRTKGSSPSLSQRSTPWQTVLSCDTVPDTEFRQCSESSNLRFMLTLVVQT